MKATPPHLRPFTDRVYDTSQLPPTPQRDYRIPAAGWTGAPPDLLSLGDDLGEPVEYKRRIGRFLLWRAVPPVGEARYMAVADDGSVLYRFDLHGRTGEGLGPDGLAHERFRTWKEALRDDE